MPLFRITLSGDVPSKKNRYRMGGGKLYQHQAVKDWMNDVFFQIKTALYNRGTWKPVDFNLALRIDFYITHDRDLDNMVTSIMDAMQLAQVFVNDRQVGKITACKFIRPKEAPHVDIWGERIA